MKLLAMCVFLLAIGASAGEPVHEVSIGEDVSFDGVNARGSSTAAITVDSAGLVTVRIGAAFPLLRDGEGYFVRLAKVRVLR